MTCARSRLEFGKKTWQEKLDEERQEGLAVTRGEHLKAAEEEIDDFVAPWAHVGPRG